MVYLLIALLIIGYVLNELSRKYSLTRLNYKRNLSSFSLEPDEEFQITTIVENNNFIPITFLKVTEKFPMRLMYKTKTNSKYVGNYTFHTATMLLLPKQRVKRTYRASIDKRGSYVLSNVDIVAGDFLGLATMSREQEINQEIVVYPREIELTNELKPIGSFYGDISVRRWIINDPVLTVGIREYTGMEPQKNIHWPSSLKNGRLMVKNFDFTTDNNVMLALNLECGKPFWRNIDMEAIEKCLSITRTIAHELERIGIPYGITTNIQSDRFSKGEYVIAEGLGQLHYSNILHLLGRANYGISTGFEEILQNLMWNQNKNVTYIFITPTILKEYVDAINNLSENVNKSIMISIISDGLEQLNNRVIVYTGKDESNEGNN